MMSLTSDEVNYVCSAPKRMEPLDLHDGFRDRTSVFARNHGSGDRAGLLGSGLDRQSETEEIRASASQHSGVPYGGIRSTAIPPSKAESAANSRSPAGYLFALSRKATMSMYSPALRVPGSSGGMVDWTLP